MVAALGEAVPPSSAKLSARVARFFILVRKGPRRNLFLSRGMLGYVGGWCARGNLLDEIFR